MAFWNIFPQKTGHDISIKSSLWETTCIKSITLFSVGRKKKKKGKISSVCRLLNLTEEYFYMLNIRTGLAILCKSDSADPIKCQVCFQRKKKKEILTNLYICHLPISTCSRQQVGLLKLYIPLDKFFFLNQIVLDIFFLHKNIYCGYSLEVPHWGTSNEYPQCMFSWWNRKNIYLATALI